MATIVNNFQAELILGEFFRKTSYEFPKDTDRVMLLELIKTAADPTVLLNTETPPTEQIVSENKQPVFVRQRDLFLNNKNKIQWFIDQYFPGKFDRLLELSTNDNNAAELSYELNNIWYLLPDNQFNIIQNPPGWEEFLQIIEEC